ncbi:hypothetical protein F5876DRAFT_81871 [Lentinula aff. lateritia]|uniref:Uncharacterized protein n=1 Tax=Lentinula aff. lateritia TaxID=2804960 RepID=A0ACC1TL56_9AGAR|nr:hypothetical protein F5876DRAFT_81871 [Lentinula aff. lateritia]
MSPPAPPVFPIFLTPPAKESFPVVQSAHEHLRHASDTIHQHRYSLASQLKGFDNRWAHVAPVLNKLTKGRQRPDEFRKNAQGLDDDVQVALEEARKRKYSRTRFADEQDSIIPGPPPSDTIYSKISRKVKALSSILERVERGEQAQPGASRTSKSPHVSSKTSSQSKQSKSRAKSPTKSPSEQSKARPSKLTVDQTSTRRPARVRKKDSRHSIRSMRSARSMTLRSSSPFRHPKPKRSSRDRLRTTSGREGKRERDRDRERDSGRDRDYRHREDRDRYRERNRDRDRDSRDRDKDRDRDRERDRNNRDGDKDRDRQRGRNSREREVSQERTRDTRHSPRSSSRHDHHHRYSPEGKTYSPGNVGQPPPPPPPHPVLSAPPAPVIPSNMPPIYARFANGHKYEYENNADLEPLQPPVLPFVTERMEKRREAREQNGRSPQDQNQDYRRDTRGYPLPSSYPLPTSSYHPQNPQIIPPSDGRGRGRDRSSRSAHRRAGYNGYEDYTYSSTSTPVIPVMATLPNSSSDPINTNIVIPAPSSTRHLSRSRYPPPSSKASRSPYLHAREEYGYNGYNGYNDYNGYGRTGAEYQGDGGHRYEPNSNVRNARSPRSPRTHYPPSPQPTRNPRSPKSPLIMRSKFKENFSVLQSESGR